MQPVRICGGGEVASLPALVTGWAFGLYSGVWLS